MKASRRHSRLPVALGDSCRETLANLSISAIYAASRITQLRKSSGAASQTHQVYPVTEVTVHFENIGRRAASPQRHLRASCRDGLKRRRFVPVPGRECAEGPCGNEGIGWLITSLRRSYRRTIGVRSTGAVPASSIFTCCPPMFTEGRRVAAIDERPPGSESLSDSDGALDPQNAEEIRAVAGWAGSDRDG